MQSFNNLDYLGDAILKILAVEIGIKQPGNWRWHENKELSKLYDGVLKLISHGKVKKDTRLAKSLHDGSTRILTTASVHDKHQKASYVEAWLGEEYLRNGIEAAKNLFYRILEVTGYELF